MEGYRITHNIHPCRKLDRISCGRRLNHLHGVIWWDERLVGSVLIYFVYNAFWSCIVLCILGESGSARLSELSMFVFIFSRFVWGSGGTVKRIQYCVTRPEAYNNKKPIFRAEKSWKICWFFLYGSLDNATKIFDDMRNGFVRLNSCENPLTSEKYANEIILGT